MPLYTVQRDPVPNRVGKHEGSHEEHFPEASIMLAFAMHLLGRGSELVEVHVDGEQAKRYDIRAWLESSGFKCDGEAGRCVGHYRRDSSVVTVDFKSGFFDVVGVNDAQRVAAECKGGIINTRHNGARSHLRKGLQEAIGQLLSREQPFNERQIAVVPRHPITIQWARRLIPRVSRAGIEIALIDRDGSVEYVEPRG